MSTSPHLEVNTLMEVGGELHRIRLNSPDIMKTEVFNQTDQLPQNSQDPPRVGKRWSELSISEEIYGSGTAGTAPPLDAHLKACAWKATNSVGVSETYSMDNNLSDDVTAATFNVHLGNAVLNSALNAVGGMNFVYEDGVPGVFNFDLFGQYVTPTEAAGSAALHAGARPPVSVNMTATVGGQTLVVKKIEGGDGNTNDSPNYDATEATGVAIANLISKEPWMKLMIDFPDFSTLNAVTSHLAETKLAIVVVHGATAGNIITTRMDGFLRVNPTNSYDSGSLKQELDFAMSYVVGDQPLEIEFT